MPFSVHQRVYHQTKKTTAAANDPIISTYEDESGQNADGRTKVPELLGMSITEATKALKEAGLKTFWQERMSILTSMRLVLCAVSSMTRVQLFIREVP